MFFKDTIYVCRGCGAMCRRDIEILPEWEKELDPNAVKRLSESKYYFTAAWCRKCAEKDDFIIFDSKHPIIRYLMQRKKYKTLVAEEFKKVKQSFLENITDEVLCGLNIEAFDWFVNGTKCGKKKAAKAFCRDAEEEIREHIEGEIHKNQNITDEKAKMEPLRTEMREFINKYRWDISGLSSLKLIEGWDIFEYSDNPDDFFIQRSNKYGIGVMEGFVETEDKISGKLWTELYKELAEIMSV